MAERDAEIARLKDELKMEKENEDRLVREFQRANNEVYGLQRQVAALIDNQTHLNSLIANTEQENARLKALTVEMDKTINASQAECRRLKSEVERLTKAGDKMAKRTEFFQKRWDADELCQEVEAWNAAKEGKQP
jgi:chromosome segregation ATPase